MLFDRLMFSVIAVLVCNVMSVNASVPFSVPLFPDGTPSSNGLENTPEFINSKGYYESVSFPELQVFMPDKEKYKGQFVMIVPGGSYSQVCVTHEGYKTVELLNSVGIAAAVLKYRMPNGHPDIPLEDGVQAMHVIRKKAASWGIDIKSLGIIGFSAGGHFVSNLITRYPDEEARPDFAVLVYPVISMQYSSARTRENLLGKNSDDEQFRYKYSTDEYVHKDMPEVLLLLSDDDTAVLPDNSICFYKAMKDNGVKAEMHVFPAGGHGFWMRERYQYADETYSIFMRWIQQHCRN